MKSDKRQTFLYCSKASPRLVGALAISRDWNELGRRVLGVTEEVRCHGHVVKVVWVPKKLSFQQEGV
jgi:hypothetical protein